MVIYNETNLTAATNLFDIAKATNDLTGGYWSLLLYASVFFVTYFALSKRYGNSKSLIGSSFFSMLVGVILFFSGWISIQIVGIPLAVFSLTLIIYFLVLD